MMKHNYKILLFHCLLFCGSLWSVNAQNGIVVTDRTPLTAVSFSESSKLTNISDSHHVDGYVKKYGASKFVFPVGQNGRYRPFAAEANEVSGAYFGSNPGAATLPQGAPFNPESKDASLSSISNVEYWDVNGINSTKVTLTWNAASSIGALTGNDLSMLTVAGWNAATARWEKISSKVDEVSLNGATSSATSGSITSTVALVPDNYLAFTLAKSTSAALPSDYAGSLEVVSCEEIRGWVWDKNYPSTSLPVELLDGQTVVNTTTANLFREDLKNAGTGTGNYGFSITVPPAYLGDGLAHQWSVRVRNSTYLLSGSPKSLTCSFGGAFEKIDCYTASGWAWDKNNPNANQTVELLEGTNVIATLIAKNYRESLKTAGIGTGNYGFDAAFPEQLRDGKIRSVSARIKGVNYVLNGSPKNLSCPLPSYQGSLEYVDCNVILGWAWDRNYPYNTMTVEVVEGTTVHATVVANLYQENLKAQGMGTGNYGFRINTPVSLKDGKPHQLGIRVKGTTTVLSALKTVNCPLNDYQGKLEYADCAVVLGWAWDRNFPNNAQTLELVEGNTIFATVLANLYQENLKTQGIGTGNYGFRISTPAALKDGQTHQLGLRVKGTTTLLSALKPLSCPVNEYQGVFEQADCNTIGGWAWDKNSPSSAVTVELMEGSVVHASVVANLYKDNLKAAGIGTGNYGFSMALPAALKDGKSHELSIRVKGSSTVIGASKTITCAINQYQGKLEYADCAVVLGWAWDRNFPNNAQTLELVEGNTVFATVLANLYQENLKTQGIGTGNYGFRISTPAILKDGQTHQLGLRVKGTTTLLSAVKPLSCPVNEYQGKFEQADCNTISGWVWDRNSPASAVTVELIEGSVIHASVVANLYKENLKTAGIGTGNYGFKIALPAALKDGKSHILNVRVKGNTFILPNSPLTVSCSASARLGGEVKAQADQLGIRPGHEESGFSFTLFPNPTSGIVTAQIGQLVGEAKLSVVNLVGRTVWAMQLSDKDYPIQQEIDLRAFPSGIYLVKLETGSKTKFSRLVLVK
jgi:hypothetical protein